MDQRQSDKLKIQDTSEYVDILARNVFDFIEDTFYGEKGYRDGTYLIPHPREVFYNTRRQSSYYKNYFRPVVNAMITPVFNTNIVRDTTDEYMAGFIENCDNAGTSLHSFMRRVMTYARMHDHCYVVMDNMPEATQAETVEQAAKGRLYPYVYLKKAQHVEDFGRDVQTDRYGNMVSIRFLDKKVKEAKGEIQLYRLWDTQRWAVQKRETGNGLTSFVTIEEGTHGLGRVPVIPVLEFAKEHNMKSQPQPTLYDLAKLNFAHFQLSSEIRNMEQSQSFSIFYGQFGGRDIVLGTHNYINLPEGATITPGFASPDGTHLVNLVNNAEKLREAIFAIAQQNGVIGVKTESGVSKEWDFRAEEATLRATAMAAYTIEMQIADLFTAYTGRAADYMPTYPERYSPTYEADRIALAMSILDRMPPEPVRLVLWEEVAENYWKSNADRLAVVKEKIGIDLENIAYSGEEPPDDNPPATDE